MAVSEQLTFDLERPNTTHQPSVADSPIEVVAWEVFKVLAEEKPIHTCVSYDSKVRADFKTISSKKSWLSEKTREFEFLVTFTPKGKWKKASKILYRCWIDARFSIDQADINREWIEMAFPWENRTIKYIQIQPDDWIIRWLLEAWKRYFYNSAILVN
jgi:hypothetical protein